MNNEMTYSEAIAELQTIVSEIEQDDVPVDKLLEKVQRASALITFCKAKLTQTEDEVHTVLESIQEKEVSEDSTPQNDEPISGTDGADDQPDNGTEESVNTVQEDEPDGTDKSGEEGDYEEDVPF